MSILKILREKLSSEDYTRILDAVGDDFDWDLVPRSRLTKVIKQRNELRELLAEQPQAQTKGDSAGAGDDDDDRELTSPAKTEAGAGAQQGGINLEEIEARHQQELNALRVRYSALDKLRAAGARDPELILNAGLIDLTKAKVTKEGSVIWPEGDADPFMALKSDESRSYLFHSDDGQAGRAPRGTGKEGGVGSDDGVTIQEAWAAAQKSGDIHLQAKLIREAYEKGIQLI